MSDRFIPTHVLDEIDAAFERAESMHEEGRELAFDVDAETGRVTAELRSPGEADVALGLTQALALACGADLAMVAGLSRALVTH